MQDTPYLIGFTAGELSPWLSCRFDLQAYQRGAAKIENFLVQPYGGLRRRPGTAYVGPASGSVPSRLVSFRFSSDNVLVLEFFPGSIRFYKDAQVVRTSRNLVYTLTTTWTTEEQIQSLHFTQINDVIYVTSPYHPPRVLKRYANNNWVIEEWKLSPFPRETYVAKSSLMNVTVYSDSTAKLSCGESAFTSAMEGEEYVLMDVTVPAKTLFKNQNINTLGTAMPRIPDGYFGPGVVYYETNARTGMREYYTCIRRFDSGYYHGSTSAADYRAFFLPGAMLLDQGEPYEVCGDWSIQTTGEWDAVWELWRSYDTYADNLDYLKWEWTCIKTFEQSAHAERKNWALSGAESEPCRMVLVCRASKENAVGAMMCMRIGGGTREYRFKITSVQSATLALAVCETPYTRPTANFMTNRWSFGAYGKRNGYPSFTSFHQGRFWFGGVAALPTTLFASAVGDFGNFRISSADDSALHLTLATEDQSRICWICPARSLLVGTTESEWILTGGDGAILTPTNATFLKQSSVGSENKPACAVENTVFYVQRGGKRLREISYKLEADGYTSTDTSLLAEHLFASGIREWTVQRGSDTRLWVLMNDGTLGVLTVNLEQQVTAWQRVSFESREVLNITSVAQSGSNEDEIWMVLRHKYNGFLSLERLNSSNGMIDGACRGSLRQMQHLAGLWGFAYPYGRVDLQEMVYFFSDGSFSVAKPDATDDWVFGAAYNSELQTLPLERDFSFNTIRQDCRVRLRLLNSDTRLKYKYSHAEDWEEKLQQEEEEKYPFTGSIRLSNIPSAGVGQGLILRVSRGFDFCLLALTVEIDYHSR